MQKYMAWRVCTDCDTLPTKNVKTAGKSCWWERKRQAAAKNCRFVIGERSQKRAVKVVKEDV